MSENPTQKLDNFSLSRYGLRPTVLRWMERRMRCGLLTIRWPDGLISRLEGDETGPQAELHVHRWRAVRRLVIGGTLGLAESYMDGDWDSPDLSSAVELGALHQGPRRESPGTDFLAWVGARFKHLCNRNSETGSKRNISYHYDLGNDFYSGWLDSTMSYSSAIFDNQDQPLEEAQENKCRRLLSLIDPKPDQRLLEIGCGWGNLARMAAREHGLSVTAITLSQEQHDFAARRVFEDGLAEKVKIEFRDYRHVEEKYDHVVSVEMFEAVGERYWPAFCIKVRDVLKPGGRAALQIITIDDMLFGRYRRSVDFIQRHVFPGGMLPSRAVLHRQLETVGLKLGADDGFGQHYARTLAAWREGFRECWPRIKKLGFDERFRRMWVLYLSYCEGGFRAGNIDVRQISVGRH